MVFVVPHYSWGFDKRKVRMAGLDHGPPEDKHVETAETAARNARVGMILFLVYLAFYASFVLINTFRPELMDLVPAAGVNLAIWYGFALIVVALVLALVYSWLCRRVLGEGDAK